MRHRLGMTVVIDRPSTFNLACAETSAVYRESEPGQVRSQELFVAECIEGSSD